MEDKNTVSLKDLFSVEKVPVSLTNNKTKNIFILLKLILLLNAFSLTHLERGLQLALTALSPATRTGLKLPVIH